MRLTLAPVLPASTFVNADVIAAQRWPDAQAAHAYEAAALAAKTRARLIERGRPFIAETVCSHPSKLELLAQARAAGSFVALHVATCPRRSRRSRVAARVRAGGHDVPVDKIQPAPSAVGDRRRRRRTHGLSDVLGQFRHVGPEQVAVFADGLVVGAPRWPTWTDEALTSRWPTGG